MASNCIKSKDYLELISSAGQHYLIELSGCPSTHLSSTPSIKDVLLEAAHEAGATIISSSFHKLPHNGVSGVVLIAESHFSIHTYPNLGYAAIDIYTCGKKIKPEKAVKVLLGMFEAKFICKTVVDRGIKEVDGYSHRIGPRVVV